MSKTTILNLAEAVFEAEAIETLFRESERIRKQKPEQFIGTIISYSKKANDADRKYLFHRLQLTAEEIILLVQTGWAISSPSEKIEALLSFQDIWLNLAKLGKIGTTEFHQFEAVGRLEILENIKFTERELDFFLRILDKQPNENNTPFESIQWKFSGWQLIGLSSVTPEPSGEELLNTALQKIKGEKNFRKPSELLRFVEPHVKKTFPKKAKPYTDKDVTEGANWFVETRKKITVKKAMTDQRSRSRVNLPMKEWNAFMVKQFGSKNPVFASKYKKTVRDEVTKTSKRQEARNSSK